ncbi:guanylate kinase [Natranaerovirga pectinivora]|uniref:Guanylate kinase n=1 Tax=Natranaerovirga pectinivora TaxID=682400 RepID=A0A4V2V0M7_9FIRM|nr:guanylate kinase [Natranaerovirga pectinivora]TCT16939.1 guanylate kinase [Natranaerovirga pectinivora]
MKNKKGLLIIISGFSGSGKGTIIKKLIEDYNYCVSISATTRQPRDYEEHGREYFFSSKDEFLNMINNNELIEWAEYCNNYYGTPKKYVEEKLQEGQDVILEIEMEGALLVKEKHPDAVLIFITPPTIDELKSRLIGRGTESEEVINLRLNKSFEEADVIEKYDYLIINDDLDTCVKDITTTINMERNKAARNNEFIDLLKIELNKMIKGED